MRIFTLGKNRIPLFYFALILFSGTFSTYGQACPTVAEPIQTFCDSESYQVLDLVAAEPNVVWYADATSTTPLRATDLLVNEKVYYAGFEGGSCASRPAVTVTVLSAPNAPNILGIKAEPTSQPFSTKQSVTSLTFCVEDVNNSDLLLDAISVEADFDIHWYASQTSSDELDVLSTELQNGAVYWVDQGDDASCRSERRSVTILLNSEEVPAGPAEQDFCSIDNPTLGSIDASGNNRYYNTPTGSSPLNENSRLALGTTKYYVSTYNPETNCESTGRLEISVTVNPIDIILTEQSFCKNQSDGNDLGLATVAHLSPVGGTWYADEDFSQLLTPETLLVDNTTYYLAPENCTSTSVLVSLDETPNAGQTSTAFFCANDGPNSDLYDQITNPDHLADVGRLVDRGSINHSAFEGLIFDPAVLGVGTHVLTHTVTAPEGSLCETDTAQITVVVYEAPVAGSDVNEVLCSSQLANSQALIAEFSSYLEGRDQTGTFTPSLPEIYAQYTANPIGTFTTTYTVTNENSQKNCSDSAVISVTIQDDSFAGNDAVIQLLEGSENTITLEEALADENSVIAPDQGGEWTDSEGNQIEGTIVPTTPGVFTYTVSTVDTCSDFATVTVQSVLQDCPVVTEPVQDFCRSIGSGNDFDMPRVSNLQPFDAVWYPSADATEPFEETTLLVDGTVYYAGATAGDCSERPTVTVVLFDTPNAGGTGYATFCASADPVNLVDYMDDSQLGAPQRTGSFNNSKIVDNIFDPADFSVGTHQFTYTVLGNENCPTDTAIIYVTITDENLPANAGGNVEVTVCSTTGVLNLNDFLGADAILGGSFSAPYENGTFDPATAETDSVEIITYTVNEDVSCVTGEDSATITLTVIPGPDAGEDGSLTLAVTAAPVNLFDSLGGTPDEGGTWSPGIANGDLDPSEFVAGTYSFTYTVTSDNGCEDTAVVSVTITGEVTCPDVTFTEQSFCESINSGNDFKLPTVSDLSPTGATWYASADATEALVATTVLVDGTTYFAGNANGTCEAREGVTVTLDDSPNAGATTTLTFCEGGEAVDLLTLINPSILGAPDEGGTFSPALASGNTLFDPAVDVAGSYTYTVQSTNDVCPADVARLTINITPSATAGGDFSLAFCADAGPQDLFTLLPEGVSTDGTFADLTDGIFDPAVNTAGDYTYTVDQTGGCEGTSTATITISISEVSEAPAAEAQSFCISEAATVADLTATGDALLWYTDAETENLADEADALVAGTYYVTNTAEGSCESAATAVEVTLTDTATPTLALDGNIFCEFDNPTIADLQANVEGTGTITWYDAASGGNVLTSSEQLDNGTTYYAASTDATSACESSVRLAVTVDLGECPVVIPEAFSPNGDKVNDTFEITYIGEEFPNYTIEIYNRWGNIVFKGNASTPNWDGVSTEARSLGDKVLPVGVYFYIVNFNDGQTAPTQGRLYLSR